MDKNSMADKTDPPTSSHGCYNNAAQRILKSVATAQCTRERAQDDTTDHQIMSQYTTFDDAIKVLQTKHSEGLINDRQYKSELDTLVGERLAELKGGGDDVKAESLLEGEARALYPQIFDSAHLTQCSEREESHRALHVSHVLPLVKAIESSVQNGGIQVASSHHFIIREVTSLKDVQQLLTRVYDEDPISFPKTVVCLFGAKFNQMVSVLANLPKDQRKLPVFTSTDSEVGAKMVDLARVFAKTGCTYFREENEILADVDREEIVSVRKLFKMLYHRPEQITRGVFVDLIKGVDKLQSQFTREKTYHMFERLLYKLSLTSPMYLCMALKHITDEWLPGVEASSIPDQLTIEQDSTSGFQCKECKRDLRGLCCCLVAEDWDEKSLLCSVCAPRVMDSQLRYFSLAQDDLVRHSHSEVGGAPYPSSHLLAHQSNVYENKLGNRQMVLPDNTRVYMSTTIREGHVVAKNPEGTKQSTEFPDEKSNSALNSSMMHSRERSQEVGGRSPTSDHKNLKSSDAELPGPISVEAGTVTCSRTTTIEKIPSFGLLENEDEDEDEDEYCQQDRPEYKSAIPHPTSGERQAPKNRIPNNVSGRTPPTKKKPAMPKNGGSPQSREISPQKGASGIEKPVSLPITAQRAAGPSSGASKLGEVVTPRAVPLSPKGSTGTAQRRSTRETETHLSPKNDSATQFFKPTKSVQLRLEAIRTDRAKKADLSSTPSLMRTEVLARTKSASNAKAKALAPRPRMPKRSSSDLKTPPAHSATTAHSSVYSSPVDAKKREMLEKRRAQMKRPGFTVQDSIAPTSPEAMRFCTGGNTRR